MKADVTRVILAGGLLLLAACGRPTDKIVAMREAMGTYVEIQALAPAGREADTRAGISNAFAVVEEVEAAASHYRDDSDIAAIRTAQAGEEVAVAEWTYRCLEIARSVHVATEGRYDVTAGPLVSLWGFGPAEMAGVPDGAAISNALRTVGMGNVVLLPGRAAVSTVVTGVDVDLSSVAKGLAADAAAAALRRAGVSNFLVNAGGEIVAASTGEKTWRVGIQVPEEGARADTFFRDRVIAVRNGAIATSGSYRRYFKAGTNTYSHIVDSRSGKPLETAIVSVTVRAESCARADAWATGLFTLPADAGLALAERLRGLECLIVERAEEGGTGFRMLATEGFEEF